MEKKNAVLSAMLPDVPRFILASGSPRRKQLLQEAGFSFNVVTVAVDEAIDNSALAPAKIAEQLATKKMAAYTDWLEDKLVLTADTLVFKEDTILGKPGNRQEAIAMIASLTGSKHQVVTSVCLGYRNQRHLFSVTTDVFFSKISDAQIRYYVDKYKPYDKAGAYGIQEWIGQVGIEKIHGSYTNVIGLPMVETYNAIISLSNKWLN